MRSWKSYMALSVLVAWTGCVDKVSFEGGVPPELPIVIDGRLSEGETARVFISKGFPVDGAHHASSFQNALVWITYLDEQQIHVLRFTPGSDHYGSEYRADTILPVAAGHRYQLHVAMPGGMLFESTPQVAQPAGSIEEITYEFVRGYNTKKNIPEDGFNVYVDASSPVEDDWHIRWRYTGTYQVQTNIDVPPCIGCPFICWITEWEGKPLLARSGFTTGKQANRNFVKYIPINIQTFSDRYHVEVVQEVISREAWEFYESIRYQLENAASLFQPAFSSVKGNIYATGTNTPVIGVFTAAQTFRKSIFIERSDVPYKVLGAFPVGPCTSLPNSTAVPPPFWD